MPENSDIIRAVKEGFKRLDPEKHHESDNNWNRAWTRAVKTELCSIGRKFGYKVYASPMKTVKSDGGEWLYDVTWLEYEKSGDGELTDAPLVAECEWDPQGIEDDFEKLLLARAGVRVMIVDVGNRHDNSEKIANRFAKKIRKFNGSRDEDAWLLAVVEQSADSCNWSFRYFHGYSLKELKH